MGALDDVNSRRLLAKAKEVCADSAKRYIFEPADQRTADHFAKIAKGQLADCGIPDPHVDASTKHIGWRDLYPRWGRQLAARFACLCLKLNVMQREKERWYHHLFPFVITRSAWIDDDALLQLGHYLVDTKWEEARALIATRDLTTWITLAVPHDIIVANIHFRPALPAEFITMSLDIGP